MSTEEFDEAKAEAEAIAEYEAEPWDDPEYVAMVAQWDAEDEVEDVIAEAEGFLA